MTSKDEKQTGARRYTIWVAAGILLFVLLQITFPVLTSLFVQAMCEPTSVDCGAEMFGIGAALKPWFVIALMVIVGAIIWRRTEELDENPALWLMAPVMIAADWQYHFLSVQSVPAPTLAVVVLLLYLGFPSKANDEVPEARRSLVQLIRNAILVVLGAIALREYISTIVGVDLSLVLLLVAAALMTARVVLTSEGEGAGRYLPAVCLALPIVLVLGMQQLILPYNQAIKRDRFTQDVLQQLEQMRQPAS